MSRLRRSSVVSSKVVALVFLVIGSMFVLVGGGFAMSSWSLLAVAQRTDGTVIRLVHNVQQGRNRGSVAPVVEFHLDGQRHEFQSWLSTSPPQFDVGDKVTVLYDPNDLQRCRIDSFVTLWLFPTIFGGLGFVAITVSGVILGVGSLRETNRSPPSDVADSANFLDERTDA